MDYEQRLKAAATMILDADVNAVNPVINTAEIGVLATLKPYQADGVSWMTRRYLLGVNVIIGIVFMRLGKTLQALCFLSYLKVNYKSPGSFLVLCPLSVTDGWVSEIAKFTPKLKVLRYVGDKEQRRNLMKTLHEHVKEQPISTGDESVLPFDVLLTTYDIALMDQDFLSQIPWHYNFDVSNVEGQLETLKCITKAFMLRRTKSKLIECGNLVLPPLTEITVMVPLNIVIQLRKACSHPYLFPGIEPEPYEEGEHLVQASGKLIILDQLLKKLHDSGHHVLLFAQMTHTLDILQDFFELRKYSYERLDGSVRAEERFSAIRSFSRQSETLNSESDNNGAFVFMMSTRAGGVGLNLVAADTVDMQALQRAHRIGQMNHVLSVNLVTRRTVEEGGEKAVVAASDLRSIIFGLQKFDPSEISTESSDELNLLELNAMIEKAIAMRDDLTLGKVDKCEFNRTEQKNGFDVFVGKSSSFVDYDPGLDTEFM
ncbi:SNF2 domain-containing protein / helicase domain-containing protein [Euphorbia peplus]|nr:SNF2 domain-containing protein / helicase domain-containing protein [Euphorbia peplus]